METHDHFASVRAGHVELQMMSPLKVCIVGLKCHDHIRGSKVPRYLGGIETQLAVLAKGLVAQGCDVSLITYDHGQADDETLDGVRVLKAYRPQGGIRFLRTIHPQSTRLWKAMRKADADVYLQMGAGLETWMVAQGCRIVPGKPKAFVFCLASDANFGAHLHAGVLGWEGKAYRSGLRRADRIIAQTRRQQDGLMQATGHSCEILPMAVIPPFDRRMKRPPGKPSRVLWIGRITPGKRLEWLLEAARELPDVRFDVVGSPNRVSEYAVAVAADADRLPNVSNHGRASAEQLAMLYQEAAVVCCTSELEGFPTTFLEAWACGIPVVTTFDPDSVVAQHELGLVATSRDTLVRELASILRNTELYGRLSNSAIRYYEENHSVTNVSRRYKEMLEDAATAYRKPGERVLASLP
jgi:glycosyltransferase involved in cell wall biosynthesis